MSTQRALIEAIEAGQAVTGIMEEGDRVETQIQIFQTPFGRTRVVVDRYQNTGAFGVDIEKLTLDFPDAEQALAYVERHHAVTLASVNDS